MRKFLKSTAAIVLIVTMVFSLAIISAAVSPVNEEPYYVPLKKVVDYAGGNVTWDEVNNRVVLDHKGDTYYFFLHSCEAYKNNEAYALDFIIDVEDNRAYASYYDISFLFEDESGYLSQTIMSTVLTSIYFMDLVSVPGITVALVDAKSGFTWTQGFGLADIEKGSYVNENTLFNLASISKSFTAVAVMQLVESGKIDLDEPIVTYLPKFSILPDISGQGDYRNITVRMLLAHASGLYPDLVASGVATINGYYPDYMNNFLDTLAELNMLSPEASTFTYANNSFTLLGLLVASISGYDSFYDGFVSYTREKIFVPAGMASTTFALGADDMPYLAQPYSDADTQAEFIYYNALPAGGIYSNAHDMARYMHMLLNGGIYEGTRILSENSVSQMMEPQSFNFEHPIDFLAPNMQPGLGLIYSTDLDGYTYVGHAGDLIHYHSNMAFDPGSGIGVFVSTNSISGMSIAQSLSAIILKNAVYEKTGSLNVPIPDLTVTPIELSANELQVYEGIYSMAGESALIDIVLEQDGVLYVNNISNIPFPLGLLPLSDGSFLSTDIGLRFWFEEIEGEMLLYYGDYKTHLIGARLDPQIYLADESFEKWVGPYVYYTEKEDQISIISYIFVDIDEHGIACIRMHALHGLDSISPLIRIDDDTYYAGEFLKFTVDGDTVRVSVSGADFIRVP